MPYGVQKYCEFFKENIISDVMNIHYALEMPVTHVALRAAKFFLDMVG